MSQKGSHVKLRNDEGRTVIVPLDRQLARGALATILRQAGLAAEQFREAFESPSPPPCVATVKRVDRMLKKFV